ncbi:SHOCT domain-containing protein [Kitasatospora brasiliensis]|uniref:SHOCT domain-containing protein n=1 Tax=Kitasatospora brasiliensis TaxID=3058040 RepID=UPI00292EAE6F|nr:SHOCT domain-containing protein [Kitasatospora sp. K002]
MRYWHGRGHIVGGWGMGLMAFGTLLFLVIVVLLAVALFRYVSHSRQPIPPGRPGSGTGGSGQVGPPGWGRSGQASDGVQGAAPEQLLAERFARGEIDAEEYRHRLDTLRSANGPGDG